MRIVSSLVVCAGMAVAGPAQAQSIDWQKVDAALGRSAAVGGDVHRYGFPRSDLQVTLDGVTIRPGLALGGWARSNRCLTAPWSWAILCCLKPR